MAERARGEVSAAIVARLRSGGRLAAVARAIIDKAAGGDVPALNALLVALHAPGVPVMADLTRQDDARAWMMGRLRLLAPDLARKVGSRLAEADRRLSGLKHSRSRADRIDLAEVDLVASLLVELRTSGMLPAIAEAVVAAAEAGEIAAVNAVFAADLAEGAHHRDDGGIDPRPGLLLELERLVPEDAGQVAVVLIERGVHLGPRAPLASMSAMQLMVAGLADRGISPATFLLEEIGAGFPAPHPAKQRRARRS